MKLVWKEKKVFVSGQSGFIGRHLVAKLKDLQAQAQYFGIDLLKDKLTVRDSFYPDYVFHVAAVAPASSDKVDFSKVIADNIAMTDNVLQYAKLSRSKVIVLSSSHVYPPLAGAAHSWKEDEVEWGKAFSPYGLSKQKVEQSGLDYAKKNNIDLLIVRLSNVYGPGDRSNRFIPTFIRKCLEKKTPLDVLGAKDTKRDYIYIDDVIRGLTESIDVLGYTPVINLGSGLGVTIGEIAEIIKKKLGRGKEKINYKAEKDKEGLSNVLDSARVKELTGFEAKTTLEAGLGKTIEWWIS